MQSKMSVMDARKGHYEIPWDTEITEQQGDVLTVAQAEAKFYELIAQGLLGATVDTSTGRRLGEQALKFDPEAEIIFTPAMAGG